MNPYVLYPSTRKDKRYTVYVPKKDTLIKVDFGSPAYDNYTIHRDARRKQQYQQRHKNDRLNDPYSAGFWSWYVLWNTPNLRESFNDATVRARQLTK